MSQSRRRRGALAVAAFLLISGVTAIAYWTAGGSGSGTAQALQSDQIALVVNQTSTLDPMYPGDSPQTLSGTFNNLNSGPVYVGTVTASITGVTKALTAPAGTCDASDFTLASAAMTVGAQVPAGLNKGSWSGATIQFNNKAGTNQNACKGATVTIGYTVS